MGRKATYNQLPTKVYASAEDYEVVTPSDSAEIEFDALYIGGAGAVEVAEEIQGATVVFSAVPAGLVLPVMGRRVMAAGTTATNIVALRWT